MNEFVGSGFQFGVGHGRVRSAKINRLRLNLLDPTARSDRLIIDFHAWMLLAEFTEPFLVERVGESCARALQADRSSWLRALTAVTKYGNSDDQKERKPHGYPRYCS